MVPFAGYEMPVQYTGVLEESRAVRASCGLFDVSHMGQFSLRGPGAVQALNRIVTNDLGKLALGQAQYNIMCEESGGTVDDLVVYYRGADHLYLCVNAANREKDFAWIREHLGPGVSLEDESDETALIAIQGPRADDVVRELDPETPFDKLRYYWAQETRLLGRPAYLSRTGYTGERGYEIYLKAADAETLWEECLERGKRHGIAPAGLGSRDTLRTEMGYPLYGHELGPELSPIAAGLNWVVKLGKASFLGQAALQREADAGPAARLRGLLIHDKRMARPDYRVTAPDGQPIGRVTSGVFSPHLNQPIALAFLDRGFESLTSCRIEIRKDTVEAQVTSLPFLAQSAAK